MATTTNFGWETPDDTDLVKDGALAIRTLGSAIDTSLVDLKGGTTGQVLSKTSNTDMDFTWVTSDDANAIQNTIVDAKGDLISASAADVPARLAVGNNGETLVADSSATTGLRWQGNYAAGKNAFINGDFRIWQRGTSFSNPADSSYTADRWLVQYNGTGATRTISQQTFTPGTAPVSGYEGTFFYRYAMSVVGSNNTYQFFAQRIEDVRVFAGQTVTISFWAKADASRNITVDFEQFFGSGGSASVYSAQTTVSATTSWARYSVTLAIPSVSGKTIGTGSFLQVRFLIPPATVCTVDFWGMQIEAGNTATAFQTATGTLAGELAACQRYYVGWNTDLAVSDCAIGQGFASSTTSARIYINLPVPMRVAPTVVDWTNAATNRITAEDAITALAFTSGVNNRATAALTATTAGGMTANAPVFLNSRSTTRFGLGAEL